MDPADAAQTEIAGSLTWSTPLVVPEAALTRYVPRDMTDTDEWDRLFQTLYDRGGPRYVLADDVRLIAPSNHVPAGFARYAFAGRKRQLGLLNTQTSTAGAATELRSEAAVLIVFPMGRRKARAEIAQDGGVETEDLEAALKRVGRPLAPGVTATGFVVLRGGAIAEVPTW